MKGSSNRDNSLLNIVKCESIDWILFAVLQVICFIYLILGLVMVKKDYEEKLEVGYEFSPGDL